MEKDEKFELLKKINTKMGWALFLLVCITLNTCSVADDIEDAVRDRPAPAAEAAPADAPNQG
jgi:hypothetical protein